MSEGLAPEAPAQPGDALKFKDFNLSEDGLSVEGVDPVSGQRIVIPITPKQGDDGPANPPVQPNPN